MEELFYWTTEDGKKIPKTELDDLHIFNIVAKFGKDHLKNAGHAYIVEKYETMYKTLNLANYIKNNGTVVNDDSSDSSDNIRARNIYIYSDDSNVDCIAICIAYTMNEAKEIFAKRFDKKLFEHNIKHLVFDENGMFVNMLK